MTTKTKRTIAEKISERMGNDGSQFTVKVRGGWRALGDECRRALGRRENRGGRHYGECRWTFPDGSAIIECEGGWDIGIANAPEDCWCWDGAGHSEECLERQAEREASR